MPAPSSRAGLILQYIVCVCLGFQEQNPLCDVRNREVPITRIPPASFLQGTSHFRPSDSGTTEVATVRPIYLMIESAAREDAVWRCYLSLSLFLLTGFSVLTLNHSEQLAVSMPCLRSANAGSTSQCPMIPSRTFRLALGLL